MKKPIIKNWIRYFTVTLAVSGMLAIGGCDNNTTDQQDTDYTTEVETAENEVGQPTRENVSQEIEADTEAEEESAPPAQETRNQSSTPRAQGINNMDSHLEEHSDANRKITETLTEAENLEQGEAAGIHQGTTTTTDQGTTTTADQYEDTDRNTYERQSDTELEQDDNMNMNQQGTTTQQGMDTNQQGTSGTNEPTQQRNTLDNEQDANIGRQGTTTQQDTGIDQQNETQRTQGVPQEEETYQGRDAEVEVDTDRQGTTQMNIDSQQQGTNPQNDQNRPMDQQQGMGTDTDTQNNNMNQQGTTTQQGQNQRETGVNNDIILGEEDETNVNVRDRESTEGESDHIRETDANRTGAATDGQNNNMDQQGTTQQGQNQQGTTDNQQSTTYHQQGNNEQGVQQTEDGTGVIIYERYSITYPESYSEEDRQRTEDIMNEYETRRESMRGQMDEETGAYMSPEVDAEPREGYDQLMRQINENINYPQDAAAAGIEGTVFVNFIVDENGNIEEAKAVDDVIVPVSSMEYTTNPLDPTKFSEEEIEDAKEEMRQEAVRAVEATSGQWQAGQQGGENVKSELQIPVRFNLENTQGTGNTIDNR